MKTILWIDDAVDERQVGAGILHRIGGLTAELAASSDDAKRVLEAKHVDAVVTDILRRNSDRSISKDDG